jgi:hypothetical protein
VIFALDLVESDNDVHRVLPRLPNCQRAWRKAGDLVHEISLLGTISGANRTFDFDNERKWLGIAPMGQRNPDAARDRSGDPASLLGGT